MLISAPKISKQQRFHLTGDQGFSLLEILVALVIVGMVFLLSFRDDNIQAHRNLKNAVDDLDRSVRFASNEAILRNSVVRLRISLEKEPAEYFVEYGPPGNLPLPELTENASPSLAEEKAMADKAAALDRQFTKVEEFDEIKQEIHPDVTIRGIATSNRKGIIKDGNASIYFYPTGEKDAALIFFATYEEFAFLEVAPFLNRTRNGFQTLGESVARIDDVLNTKMDEIYREWGKQ